MKGKIIILIVFASFLALPATVSAAHFITGFVNNSFDGTSSNNYIITLWNPANGINDNRTDLIGPSGNSGADNIYFIDCELLTNGCAIGDTLNARVFGNGTGYKTNTTNLIVTGAGFDLMPNLRLNTPPNISLIAQPNFANISSTEINLSCTANDPDANLANVTLYGNWSEWHANQTTTVSGSQANVNFTTMLPEGTYHWSCQAEDDLAATQFAEQNYTFTLDTTPPSISEVVLNQTGEICGIAENIRVNCTTTDTLSQIQNVIIQANTPAENINYTAQPLSQNTYTVDIPLNQTGTWNFTCIAQDHAGNIANLLSTSINIFTNDPDITLASTDITFSEQNPIENAPLTINAQIHNNGCTDANNFLVGFFTGDPDAGGNQINGNQTISIAGRSNTTTNVTWNAEIGLTNIYVEADHNDTISENNETNNKANKTITINAWQDFYGNVTLDKLLADQNIRNLSVWLNESTLSGNVFIADTESDITWHSLYALGKNTSGDNTTNDFNELDTILSMENFSDSITNKFTTDGNTPRNVTNFFVHQQNIFAVPAINTTNTTNFITGILWDASDDSNQQFDTTDQEDIVFITKVNSATQGNYGIYDYEITIPARLREYGSADTNNVFIYFDLN